MEYFPGMKPIRWSPNSDLIEHTDQKNILIAKPKQVTGLALNGTAELNNSIENLNRTGLVINPTHLGSKSDFISFSSPNAD